MNLGVAGLWHLGSVTAACMAESVPTLAWDPSVETVRNLAAGRPPVDEPGLDRAVRAGLDSGRLRFVEDATALNQVDVLWITIDTPVDDDDQADVQYVESQILRLVPFLKYGALILVSSQVPVGFTARIRRTVEGLAMDRDFRFAYTPENLRLGGALEAFRKPQRIVVGAEPRDRIVLSHLLEPIGAPIEWMSVASAELTKHALNAFLATSVTFINEIASIAEHVGADGGEVRRGLITDVRIGPRAYLRPGAAFAGGTLARDLVFLAERATELGLPASLLRAVKTSNDEHRGWAWRILERLLDGVRDKKIAVLGLTYKPGTNTLRRSSSIELCQRLASAGAKVLVHDPAIKELPGDLGRIVTLCSSPADALRGADAVVVATEWPEFKSLSADDIVSVAGHHPLVIDASHVLGPEVSKDTRIQYVTVGSGGS